MGYFVEAREKFIYFICCCMIKWEPFTLCKWQRLFTCLVNKFNSHFRCQSSSNGDKCQLLVYLICDDTSFPLLMCYSDTLDWGDPWFSILHDMRYVLDPPSWDTGKILYFKFKRLHISKTLSIFQYTRTFLRYFPYS